MTEEELAAWRVQFYEAIENSNQNELVQIATFAMMLWIEKKLKEPQIGAEAFKGVGND